MSKTRNQKKQDRTRLLFILSIVIWTLLIFVIVAAPAASVNLIARG